MGGRSDTLSCMLILSGSTGGSDEVSSVPRLPCPLSFSLDGCLTFLRGLFLVICVSFFALELAEFSSSTNTTSSSPPLSNRLGGGAARGVSGREDDREAAPEGLLYMVLELLSLFCRALNFAFPSKASISSRESSGSPGGGELGRVGVADIAATKLKDAICRRITCG